MTHNAYESYGRRWLRHAFAATTRSLNLHRGAFLLALIGPSIGILALPVATGSATIPESTGELVWLVYGLAGTIAVLVVVFLWQLVLAPSSMEDTQRQRHAAELADAQATGNADIDRLRQELGQAQEEGRRLSDQIAGSAIQVEVAHVGPSLVAVNASDGVRDAFIEAERG